MGFWAGFADEFSKLQDRREKREMLMGELLQKRKAAVAKALEGKQLRTTVSAKEENALSLLRNRLKGPDGELVEGAEESLEAWRKTGTASQVLKMAQGFEDKSESKEVRLTGERLINSFYVAGGEEPEAKPTKYFLNLLEGNKLLDGDAFTGALTAINALPKQGETNAVVDFNPAGAFSGSEKVRGEVLDAYTRRLTSTLTQAYNSESDPQAKSQMIGAVQALSGEDGLAKNKALTEWAASPWGAQVYGEMISAPDIPAYQELDKLGGEFVQAKDIYNLQQNWDTLEEEERDRAFQTYPSLQNVFNRNQEQQ